MGRTYAWEFPLTRTHTGMLLGNGTLGAMIWGEGGVLRITIGRADYWDHRGGLPWTERMSYASIRACLEKGDEKGLRELFEKTPSGPGQPPSPTILPIGRIELDFGKIATLTTGSVDIDDGTAAVTVKKAGRAQTVKIALDMASPVLCVSLPKALSNAAVNAVTAWDTVGERLRSVSFKEPELLATKQITGWVQERPADPALCVGYRKQGAELLLTAVYGSDPNDAKAAAIRTLDSALGDGFRGMKSRNAAWWRAYWRSVPVIDIPNERLSFAYHYGMYKFASFTNPAGVPATLQGPWIEEYQMPPWSSDYHFNINVQMCYQPAYHGNRLENLLPLFDMIFSWTDTLRHNAKVFLGIDDGLMLPHAVDDRCTCMGGFWTGSVDHGCTAWVALMMYRYWRYTMDERFLRERAYPFMVGAMRVYEEMLERDGDAFVLPVSVSPEYRGAEMNAWGRNASFQLACIHALCEALLGASAALGLTPKPIWKEILAKLPKACLMGPKGDEMIALWEGTPLEESHRHHSHLAGITPFDAFDLDDPEWRKIVGRSLNHWIIKGCGLWSGWCVPWAAAIHMHFDRPDAAELLLEIWEKVYTNEGHGTLHDAHTPGFTIFGQNYGGWRDRAEIMQMDAGMGATAAVQEMMLHTRRGVNHLFAGAPKRWEKASFSGVRTDGAFLVSARRERGQVTRIIVQSPAGGVFRLANPWDGPACVKRKRGAPERVSGRTLEIETTRGESITIVRS